MEALHHNLTIRPSTGVHESRTLSSIYYYELLTIASESQTTHRVKTKNMSLQHFTTIPVYYILQAFNTPAGWHSYILGQVGKEPEVKGIV